MYELLKFKDFINVLLGFKDTLIISLVTIIVSIITGMIYSILKLSNNKILNLITFIYFQVVKLIPLLLFLFIFYYLIPRILNVSINNYIVALIVFIIWATAELGEIITAGIKSLPKGQLEASQSIGLSKFQIFIYIQLPQSIKRIIPGGINLFTRIIKTTSLVVFVGVTDVIKVGRQIIERTNETFIIYGFIFILFFVTCYFLSRLSVLLEKRWEI